MNLLRCCSIETVRLVVDIKSMMIAVKVDIERDPLIIAYFVLVSLGSCV